MTAHQLLEERKIFTCIREGQSWWWRESPWNRRMERSPLPSKKDTKYDTRAEGKHRGCTCERKMYIPCSAWCKSPPKHIIAGYQITRTGRMSSKFPRAAASQKDSVCGQFLLLFYSNNLQVHTPQSEIIITIGVAGHTFPCTYTHHRPNP